MNWLLYAYWCLRVLSKQIAGIGPLVPVRRAVQKEFHGGRQCGVWALPRGSVGQSSVVVDFGLGEDISCSQFLIDPYGCRIYGFDPTPKAVAFVRKKQTKNIRFFDVGVAGSTRHARPYLLNDKGHESGSTTRASHVGLQEVDVHLLGKGDLRQAIVSKKMNVLNFDIEGAEYELLGSHEMF